MTVKNKEDLIIAFCKQNGGKISSDECLEIINISDDIPYTKRAYVSNLLGRMKRKGILLKEGICLFKLNENNGKFYSPETDIIFF